MRFDFLLPTLHRVGIGASARDILIRLLSVLKLPAERKGTARKGTARKMNHERSSKRNCPTPSNVRTLHVSTEADRNDRSARHSMFVCEATTNHRATMVLNVPQQRTHLHLSSRLH
jgi:negative regulator of replication initiation